MTDEIFNPIIEKHPIEKTGRTCIRTKQMVESIGEYWGGYDVAHIWVENQMYRITKKGTLIRCERKEGYE